MSQIPRRTTEFQLTSSKKSMNPRPSRSGIGTSASLGVYARSSATPSTRMTPARTPNRSHSKDRNTMIPMTAEKEKAPVDDKFFIQAKTQQVLEELAEVDSFTELIQKGLKSMTHKQFIMILQHLLRPIVGNITLDGSNYVDYVYNLLISMDYPYTINKSSLKTPSALHCQNGIIILLAWLSEFRVKESEDVPLFQYSRTDDFDSSEMSQIFMQKTASGFLLWNNQQETESDCVMEEIRQAYISKRNGNCEDLDAEIERLKKSFEDLKKETRPISLQKTCVEKKQELKILITQCEEVEKSVEDDFDDIRNIKAELQRKEAMKTTLSEELSVQSQKLMGQKMTTSQKTSVLHEICEARSVLEKKKKTAKELIESGSEREIQLSLLTQKKFHLINKLNNIIYTLTGNFEIDGWEEQFDPTAYEIKTIKLGEESKLYGEIEHLFEGLKLLQEKYRHSLNSAHKEILKLDTEKQQLESEDAGVVKEHENLKDEESKISAEEDSLKAQIKEADHCNSEVCNQLLAQIEELDDDIVILNSNMAKFNELNPLLMAEIKKFQASSLITIKEFYNKRKIEVEEQRQKVNRMKHLLDEFKNRAPFPDDVQKTIDEVMKKQQP